MPRGQRKKYPSSYTRKQFPVLRVNKNQQLHGATIVAKNQQSKISVSLVETILRHVAKHQIQKNLVLINK